MNEARSWVPTWSHPGQHPPVVRVAGHEGYLLAWRRVPGGPWQAFVCWAELRPRADQAAGGGVFRWREEWLDSGLVEWLPSQDYRRVLVYEQRGSTWVRTRPPVPPPQGGKGAAGGPAG
jgi:hypothetical protein